MDKNIINQKFGKLTVIEPSEKRSSSGNILYKCQCDCGNITYVTSKDLKSGHSKSCGCVRKEKFLKHSESSRVDLTNKRFGKLTAIKYVKSDKGSAIWLCRCDCGNNKEILAHSLLTDYTTSCGCISKEIIKREGKKNCIDNTNVAIVKSLLKDNKSKITASGVKGVGWDKKSKKWRAYIMFQGKYYHLGYFTELDDAIKVRKEAEKKMFKEFLELHDNK